MLFSQAAARLNVVGKLIPLLARLNVVGKLIPTSPKINKSRSKQKAAVFIYGSFFSFSYYLYRLHFSAG